ncbi:MAG: reverse transcriptase N-terminal domain-containing protein [Chloroflexi bacterium]|nr:reverse transcriptase N-terminal domain-containing protein [Chloroflexota bacterium]
MTAALPAGATSHGVGDRRPIDRARVDHVVRRLQARIVKATQEGRPGRVRALQWLLTHSFSGRALAVARAADAPDGCVAGMDRELWPTVAARALAVRRLRRHGYRPAPVRRIMVAQADGTVRRIGVPTLRDRAMLWLQRLALEPVVGAPAGLPDRATMIARAHALLATQRQLRWVLIGDLAAGAARLSPHWLARMPLDPLLRRAWSRSGQLLGAGSAGGDSGGVPGIIAPLLVDLLLDDVARQLRRSAPMLADDQHAHVLLGHAGQFIVAGASREALEALIMPRVRQALDACGLAPDRAGLVIRPVSGGFEFLGQHIRRVRGRLVVGPARTSMRQLLTQLRALVRCNRGSSAGRLVQVLNPPLRRWARQHRFVTGRRAFADVDHALSQVVWRWAKRRHPNKSHGWIFARYFCRADGTRGFHGEHAGHGLALYRARDAAIVRLAAPRPGRSGHDPYHTAPAGRAGADLQRAAASPSGAFARLEPDDRQRSRPVLRGGGTGDAGSLPDSRKRCASTAQP